MDQNPQEDAQIEIELQVENPIQNVVNVIQQTNNLKLKEITEFASKNQSQGKNNENLTEFQVNKTQSHQTTHKQLIQEQQQLQNSQKQDQTQFQSSQPAMPTIATPTTNNFILTAQNQIPLINLMNQMNQMNQNQQNNQQFTPNFNQNFPLINMNQMVNPHFSQFKFPMNPMMINGINGANLNMNNNTQTAQNFNNQNHMFIPQDLIDVLNGSNGQMTQNMPQLMNQQRNLQQLGNMYFNLNMKNMPQLSNMPNFPHLKDNQNGPTQKDMQNLNNFKENPNQLNYQNIPNFQNMPNMPFGNFGNMKDGLNFNMMTPKDIPNLQNPPSGISPFQFPMINSPLMNNLQNPLLNNLMKQIKKPINPLQKSNLPNIVIDDEQTLQQVLLSQIDHSVEVKEQCFVCHDILTKIFLEKGMQTRNEYCRKCKIYFHPQCINKFYPNIIPVCPRCVFDNLDPFNLTISQIMAPKVLYPKAFHKFEFKLTQEQIDTIVTQQDCYLEIRSVAIIQQDNWFPQWIENGSVKINDQKVGFFQPLPKNSSISKRKDQNFLTKNGELLKKDVNELLFQQKLPNNDQFYLIGINIIKIQTAYDVIQYYKNQQVKSIKMCKQILMKEIKNQEINSLKVIFQSQISLRDAIDLNPIKNPVRGQYCKHFTCCSLENLIKSLENMHNRRWSCPICKSPIQGLEIDSFIYQILINNPKAIEIQMLEVKFFNQDGTYQIIKQIDVSKKSSKKILKVILSRNSNVIKVQKIIKKIKK